MFKENLELREQVFKKMGWIPTKVSPSLYNSNKPMDGFLAIDGTLHGELPPIETSWEVCVKYLAPFMRKNNWEWYIPQLAEKLHFTWFSPRGWDEYMDEWHSAEIISDNIALAACQAFLEVEL